MKSITRALLTGLSILLPVLISVQIVVWLLVKIEQSLRPLLLFIIPDSWYLPGLAIVSFLAICVVVGTSIKMELLGFVWKLPGKILERIPVAKYVYSTLKDFFDLVGGKTFSDQSVVWVKLPDSDSHVMGIVTQRGDAENSQLADMIDDDHVAVYLPMSYQAGGYMLVLPEKDLEKVDIDPTDALRLIMSAGLGQKTG